VYPLTIQSRYRTPSYSGRKAKIEIHCSNGTKAIYNYDDSLDSFDNHQQSAQYFCEQHDLGQGPFLQISKLPLGGYVFIGGSK